MYRAGVTLALSFFLALGLLFMGAMLALMPPPPHGPGLHGPPVAMLVLFGLFCALGIVLASSRSSPDA